MKRDVETLLLDFCLQQKERFELSPWLDLPAASDDKATVALYLANTSWFGHRRQLLDVAERLHSGCVGHFSEMARLTDFDPSRFRGRLRPDLRMNKAFPELSQALSLLLDQIDASIRRGGYGGPPIAMYLAGGMAVNFYCGTRYTEDVDAFYSRRLHVGRCEVAYRQKDGHPSFLYLDNNYNPTFGLLHENYDRNAVEWTGIGNERRRIHLYVLSPVDLAVTKISRHSEQDREDIVSLANAGLFSADQLRNHATEALRDFVGDQTPVKTSIDLIYKQISGEKIRQPDRAPEFTAHPPKVREGKEREIDLD